MKSSWKVSLAQKIEVEFGESAQTIALRNLTTLEDVLALLLRQHQDF
jgi:hypothetical protein